MGQFFDCIYAAKGERLNYGKRLEIYNRIDNFIKESKFTIQGKDDENKAVIVHIRPADINILWYIIVKLMDENGYCCTKSQEQIAKALNLSEKYVCRRIGELTKAGFIYKTQRYREKLSTNTYDDGDKTVKCVKTLRHKLGYHLTPNLINRIFDALKKKINQLANVDLKDRVKTILFTTTSIIRHFFNGKKTIEINPVHEAKIKAKQREDAQKQDFINDYKNTQYNNTANKPEHEKSTLDKALSQGLALFRSIKPTTQGA